MIEVKVYGVKVLHSQKDKTQTALLALCSSLVSKKARDQGYAKHDQTLVGFCLSIPCFTALNIATGPISAYSLATTLPLAITALAIPFLLVASLSLSSSLNFRRVLLALLAPVGFLLITLGFINLLAAGLLVLAVITNESLSQRFDRMQIALSSITLVTLASVCLGISGDLTQQLSNVWQLSSALIGAMIYAALSNSVVTPSSAAEKSSTLEVAMQVANAGAMASFQVDRTGYVHQTSPNLYEVLTLEKFDVIGLELLARLHLADKVSFLTALDSVACNGGSAQCKVRFQRAAKYTGSTSWAEVKCTIIGCDTQILLVIDAANNEPFKSSSNTISTTSDGMGPSALAIVSHELRTPLNAIIGFSDLMNKGMAGPIANERQKEYVGLINQSGNHLLELVNSILDLSKLENGTFELEADAFLPEEAAQFAVSLLAHQANEKSIGLDYLPLSGLETFAGDKRVCRQIILNLLSNAVKFTPENGQIRLRVETEDHRLLITVEDNGIGMSPEQLAKVGTPFYQAGKHLTRAHNGAGLGLSLVRQMAKLHGGAMEIDCASGIGTTVRVALGSLGVKQPVLRQFTQPADDESLRIIQIIEESDHVPQRKTA